MRLSTPTWGAARPTPWAARRVSSRSSPKRASSASNRDTGSDRWVRTGSPNSRISSNATWRVLLFDSSTRALPGGGKDFEGLDIHRHAWAAGPGPLGEQGAEGPGRRLGVLDLGDDTPASAHGRRAEQLDLGPEGGGQGGHGRGGLARLRSLDQDQAPGRGEAELDPARQLVAPEVLRVPAHQGLDGVVAAVAGLEDQPAGAAPGGAPGAGRAPGPGGPRGRPDLGLAEGG